VPERKQRYHGPTVAIVSFRLGGGDGVSVEAAKWAWAFGKLGCSVYGVAGEGVAEHLIPALAIGASPDSGPATRVHALAEALDTALARADLVVVENLCSLPLNPQAWDAVAAVLRGRPAVLHHHDLPWQRERFRGYPPPPHDPAWRHVTVNDMSRLELADVGINSTTIYNAFDLDPAAGRRAQTRTALGVAPTDLLVLQPTRALARKRVPAAIGLAEDLDAAYWLLGPAEEGYDEELDRVLAGARCTVHRGPVHLAGGESSIDDAYAAADVVALPSSWEGFGNPALEAATHRRPLFVGHYPVAKELAAFGFEWFFADASGRRALAAWLRRPDLSVLDRNADVARRHFGLAELPARLRAVMAEVLDTAALGTSGVDTVPGTTGTAISAR
jgi:mannosylglucosylglycerate synthase